MRPALLVFGYALAVAWLVPPPLARLTRSGTGARLGIAVWLAAMASALAAAAAALAFLVRAAFAGWPQLAEAVCRSVAGGACTPVVYRGAAFELALGAAAAAAALTAAALAWRYGRTVRRAALRTRAHNDLARITGRRLPGAPGRGGAVIVDAPQPVAYCVPGRPAAIVLTSAVVDLLEPAQLSAVLAHERAHLAGRHHVLIALTRGLAACFPFVPLCSRGAAEVARLAEMCADDAAARRTGRHVLVAALLAMGTGTAVPAGALAASGAPASAAPAASGAAVAARMRRLLDPPPRARHAGYLLAQTAAMVLLALIPVVVTGIRASRTIAAVWASR